MDARAMPKTPRFHLFAYGCLAFCLLTEAPLALAAPSPDPNRKAACAAAYEKGQEAQNESKLVEAREFFLACSAEDCPNVVRTECNAALPSLDTSIPTIVLGARDDKGNDIVDAEVKIDGAIVSRRLDGKAIFVNPGPHQFQFSTPNAEAIERQIVVRVGEKNRAVTVDFKTKQGGSGAVGEGKTSDSSAEGANGKRIGAYVLGGLGVASLGAFAILGITGKSTLSDLQNGCGKTHSCDPSDVDAVKTKLMVADISLGVGVLSLGVAAALFFTSKNAPAKPTTGLFLPTVAPVPGGGVLMLGGQF